MHGDDMMHYLVCPVFLGLAQERQQCCTCWPASSCIEQAFLINPSAHTHASTVAIWHDVLWHSVFDAKRSGFDPEAGRGRQLMDARVKAFLQESHYSDGSASRSLLGYMPR